MAQVEALQACTETRTDVSVGTMGGVPKSILCLKKWSNISSPRSNSAHGAMPPPKAMSQMICMVHTGMTSVLCGIISSGVLVSIYSGLR